MIEIKLFFISLKFGRKILLILKRKFLPDLRFKSFDSGFIRFLVSSAFRGYLVHKILSSLGPSI